VSVLLIYVGGFVGFVFFTEGLPLLVLLASERRRKGPS
jgi:hypothetical protein